MLIEPSRLAEIVRTSVQSSENCLTFFWFTVPVNRSAYAKELREHQAGRHVVVYELKSPELFANANALQSDIARVVTECKAEIETMANDLEQLAIIVLSKLDFFLPVISSPADLPVWYPRHGGESINVPVVDLSWAARGNLKSPEVDVDTISSLLFDFNSVACRLMRLEHSARPQRDQAFIQAINAFSDLRKKGQRFDSAEQFLDSVEESQLRLSRIGYRPSARHPDSIVSVLMRFASSSTPEDIHKKAILFGRALGIANWEEPFRGMPSNLISVLFRPTNPPEENAGVLRDVLLTIFLACQLTTASAHADGYGMFSLQLLDSISRHLSEVLSAIIEEFESRIALLERESSSLL